MRVEEMEESSDNENAGKQKEADQETHSSLVV